MRGLADDIRGALRATRRNPGFGALCAFTIALGIAAVTSAFAVLDTVLLRPLPYAQGDQLVMVRERTAKGAERPPSFPNFDDWRSRARSFKGVAAVSGLPSQTLVLNAEPLRVSALGVSRDFFRRSLSERGTVL